MPYFVRANKCSVLAPARRGHNFRLPHIQPHVKMSSSYKYFYAIAVSDKKTSPWFDKAIKVDAKRGKTIAEWSSKGIFMSEFDVVPKTSADDEDDAVDDHPLQPIQLMTLLSLDCLTQKPLLPFSCKNGFSRTVSCARHCLF